jgi:hypothetical protein
MAVGILCSHISAVVRTGVGLHAGSFLVVRNPLHGLYRDQGTGLLRFHFERRVLGADPTSGRQRESAKCSNAVLFHGAGCPGWD